MSIPPPHRVPTLTEVVAHEPAPPAARAPADAAEAAPARTADAAVEAALAQRVLDNVQRQVDLLLEQRLREAIVPAVARLGDALVQDLRAELAATLSEIVARAVTQELSRHRER